VCTLACVQGPWGDTQSTGPGGWGEAAREVAHMAAWVMRQMDPGAARA